jgi:hypothetical protein
MKDAQVELQEAIGCEAEAHALLLTGDWAQARARLHEAADHYRRSWDLAPPTAYGRLIGMMKAAVLAGEGVEAAVYARRELDGVHGSAAAAYALALAALVDGDDDSARERAQEMRGGSDALDRTADAIDAITEHDAKSYAAAIAAIVRDFEGRSEHLTGVAIADTALCLELLAEPRGLTSGIKSPLLPP